jgi:hypothetical protein
MTYLVKYTDLTKDFPQPADIDVIDRWEFVDKICEGNSLRDINKYLMKKELPTINSMENARLSGIMLVYSNSVTEQIYILDSEHKGCVQIMRDYKLKNILK